MNFNYKFSIIIAVYNLQDFISDCIESLLKQTYKNFEVIIVNDGSNDNSVAIINNYVQKYNNIQLINQENLGVSAARNSGLSVAQGEYILFVDGDDWLTPNALEKINNYSNIVNPEIIIFDYYKYNNGKVKLYKKNLLHSKIYNNHIDKQTILRQGGVTAWQKAYKKSFLNKYNITFIDNILYEDVPFHWVVIISSNAIAYLPEAIYYYRQRKGSIMSSIKDKKYQDSLIILESYISNFLISNNLFQEYGNLFNNKIFKMYHSLLRQSKNKKDFFKIAYTRLKNYNLDNAQFNFIKKLSAILIQGNKYLLWRIFFFK